MHISGKLARLTKKMGKQHCRSPYENYCLTEDDHAYKHGSDISLFKTKHSSNVWLQIGHLSNLKI